MPILAVEMGASTALEPCINVRDPVPGGGVDGFGVEPPDLSIEQFRNVPYRLTVQWSLQLLYNVAKHHTSR